MPAPAEPGTMPIMHVWITTHWPVPESDTQFSRHVYIQDWNVSVPQAGDLVLVREAVAVRGQIEREAVRCHQGTRTKVKLPKGSGGLIGSMTVKGKHRNIGPADVVYDYDDLDQWKIIECENFQPARLPLPDLMELIGKSRDTTPRFLALYQVPDRYVSPLLARVGL